ncbi:ribonuclease HII [Pseudonocardia acaciae]|uniref:ribonuclease HII n=1 Tax=Pseudonocardia acaciae TaxID=551276 RepID=UPI001B801942|nr:ribonuclease HII [Pseudonocardia acaciae]
MARTIAASSRSWPRPQRAVVRRSTGIWAWESALRRHGLGPVAGVDEAGRGACAGPLVVAACVPRPGDASRWDGLTDSKLLTPGARERFYELIVRRAVDYAVVIIPPAEVDHRGVHVANVAGMRRAVARLGVQPGYVLTDGFRVPGLTVPNLAVPKGDQAAACVAAASVLAKVTRDRIMVELDREYPCYGFAEHKGYCTPAHDEALAAHGPSRVHRYSFVNVSRARGVRSGPSVVHNLEVQGSSVEGNGTLGAEDAIEALTRAGVDS